MSEDAPISPVPKACQSLTKAGKPCRAMAINGGPLCRAHSMTADELAKMREKSHQSRREAAQRRAAALESARMGTKARLAALVEEKQAEMVAAFTAALETGDQDALRRAQAAELLLSRVHGRPTQPTQELAPDYPKSLDEVFALSVEDQKALLRTLPQ